MLPVFWLLIICSLFTLTIAQNSCGRESIPYLLSVDLSGKPELACDTPACFGPLKSPTNDEYEDNEEPSNKMHLSAFERTASCTGKFTELPCLANDEWTGGVNEINNGTHITLSMECCQFSGLNYATEYKTIILRPGDRFVGGAVKEKNRLIAFDLIKEIRKNVSALNEISYIASVFRMSCVPEPNPLLNKVDSNLESGEYLSKQLGNKRSHSSSTGGHSGGIRKNHYHPKHYSSQTDYDYSRERSENRVRPGASSRYDEYPSKARGRYGRRRYYKPIVDDYEYYEIEPIPMIRRAMYKRLRAKYDEDQLWPIAYAAKTKKVHGLRSFSNDLAKEYQEFNGDNKLPQIYTETQAPPVVLPAAQRDTYVRAPLAPAPIVQTQVVPATIPVLPTYVAQPIYTSYGTDQTQNNYVQPVAPSYSTYEATQSTCGGTCSSASSSSCGGCSMNSMFSSMQCFSSDMLVRTSKGEKRMDELVIGDLGKFYRIEIFESIDGSMVSFSPIIMFLHRKVAEPAIFLQFKTSVGSSIKITAYHLIYTSKCQLYERLKLVRAAEVQIGDCIHVVKGSALHSTRVVSVEEVEELGIYAPLTQTGNIVVNSVLASCHNNLAAQTLQQTFFIWWRELNSVANYLHQLISYVPKTLFSNGFLEINERTNVEEAIPFGVEYLVTIVDLFIPNSMFM